MPHLHEIRVKLSQAQARKVKKGETVRLSKNALNGDASLMVSKMMLNKLMKRRAQGKGMELRLTQKQIKGSGFFQDVIGVVVKGAKALAKHQLAASKAIGILKSLGIPIPSIVSEAGKAGEKILPSVIKVIDKLKLEKKNVKKAKLTKSQNDQMVKRLRGSGFDEQTIQGMGFFTDVGKALGKAGKFIFKNRKNILEGVKTAIEIANTIKKLKGGQLSKKDNKTLIDELERIGFTDKEIIGMGFFKDVGKALGKAGKFIFDNRKNIADGVKTAVEIANTIKKLKGKGAHLKRQKKIDPALINLLKGNLTIKKFGKIRKKRKIDPALINLSKGNLTIKKFNGSGRQRSQDNDEVFERQLASLANQDLVSTAFGRKNKKISVKGKKGGTVKERIRRRKKASLANQDLVETASGRNKKRAKGGQVPPLFPTNF